MSETIIDVKNLQKKFPHQLAVKGIDFSVYRGECLGILGPNGAGKTTTLRILLGLALPTNGSIRVLNYHLPEQAALMRTKFGVVPQADNLDPDFSVIENIYTYATYFGIPRSIVKPRALELLKFAALEHKADVKVTTLSGGMKRRLVLARALINQPEIMVLDEPTTGLDPQARQLIWQKLRQLKNQGVTLILTTHYMEEAERLCDRLLIMDEGKILAEGPPQILIKKYIEPIVFEIQNATENELTAIQSLPQVRTEQVGETLFCYCTDEKSLLQALQHHPHLQFIRRPGNLEDVFIKLTGRELRKNA